MGSGEGAVRIDKYNYPNTFKTLYLIKLDNGGINKIEGTTRHFKVPDWVYGEIGLIESTLAVMTPEEIEMICTGEESEQAEVVRRYDSDGQTVHEFLNKFFEEWM
jgi:hypothetical protein